MKIRSSARGAQPTKNPSLLRISVVDDEPDMLALFNAMAEDGYFRVVGAYCNAGEALHNLLEVRPEIVFMDLLLPDMSGIECTKRLVSLLPGLRIVMITSHADRTRFVAAIMAGASGFLDKPFSVQELLKTVKEVTKYGFSLGRTALPYLIDTLRSFRDFAGTYHLSSREEKVLAGIFANQTYKEIAASLDIRESTVHTHMYRMFKKLRVHSRRQLIAEFLHRF